MIYLLGGSGYVGAAFVRLLTRKGCVFAVLKRSEFDYTDEAKLTGLLLREKPSFLINAAGYTGKPNVDACEFNKAECLAANAVFPGLIARACETANIPWGHVSSGCIFSGSRPDGSGFTEIDSPNFSFRSNHCSFYSGTKALGEEILTAYPDIYIWRMRVPFNEIDSPRNYLSKLMHYERLLDAENSITQIDEFAAASIACWEKRIPFGIYNVTNPGGITTREVVDLIKKSGLSEKSFQFFRDEDEFMKTISGAPRSNCLLNSGKLADAGIQMTEVHDAIERDVRRWVKAS
jgi:dTDP-4-dehydrorhamnose reductase